MAQLWKPLLFFWLEIYETTLGGEGGAGIIIFFFYRYMLVWMMPDLKEGGAQLNSVREQVVQ